VFGPGLNRAYYLESVVAEVPRLVVGPEVIEEVGSLWFVASEENVLFLDSFSIRYLRYVAAFRDPDLFKRYNEAGLPVRGRPLREVPLDDLLRVILDKLKNHIRAPLADKEWRKVAWLYDRLAQQLGVPPASSYPRVKPSDLVE
jgi:hypothetical protein